MNQIRLQEQRRMQWWNFKYYSKQVLKWVAILGAVFFLGYHVGHEDGREEATAEFVNEPFESIGSDFLCELAADRLGDDAKRCMTVSHKKMSRRAFGENVRLEFAVIEAWSELLVAAERKRQQDLLRSRQP